MIICDLCGIKKCRLGTRTYDGRRYRVCYACQCERARQKKREGQKRRHGQQRAKRYAIKERGDACEWCGNDDAIINLHHKIRLMDGGDHSPENILLLCDGCHDQAHINGTRW